MYLYVLPSLLCWIYVLKSCQIQPICAKYTRKWNLSNVLHWQESQVVLSCQKNIYFEHMVSFCTQIQTYSSYFVKPITINKSCQQMIQKFWVIPRNFTRGKTFYTSAARDDRDKLNRKGIKLWFPWNNLPKLTYKIILNFYSYHINLIINYDCYVKNIHISDSSISISLEPLSFSYHTYRNFPSHLTSPTC